MKTEQEIKGYRDALAEYVVAPCDCETPEAQARCRFLRESTMAVVHVMNWIVGDPNDLEEIAAETIRLFQSRKSDRERTKAGKFAVVTVKFKGTVREITNEDARRTQIAVRRRAILRRFLKENGSPIIAQNGVPTPILVGAAKSVVRGHRAVIMEIGKRKEQ